METSRADFGKPLFDPMGLLKLFIDLWSGVSTPKCGEYGCLLEWLGKCFRNIGMGFGETRVVFRPFRSYSLREERLAKTKSNLRNRKYDFGKLKEKSTCE
jgi:hypothetical protein